MTSPVDTTVKWFSSKMTGAPVLTGQPGSLIALLDACLFNGWGIQTASSCVVADGVCTLTFPLNHAALPESVLLVAGASIAALNGEQKVTAVSPNVVKFATAAANGTATGTITAKLAPMGFNKPFSGTNLAVYKSASVQGNGQFVRVSDPDATVARAIGYETMTGVSTGTGLFPTAAQVSGGANWIKSWMAGTMPIEWTVYGDARFFAVFASPFVANGAGYELCTGPVLMAFGDTAPCSRAADPFSTLIIGSPLPTSMTARATMFDTAFDSLCRHMPRDVSGTGTAVSVSALRLSFTSSAEVYDRISGQISFSKVALVTSGSMFLRSVLPGIGVGTSIKMEQVFSQGTLFKAGTPERSYLAILDPDNLSFGANFNLIALDLTGPIR